MRFASERDLVTDVQASIESIWGPDALCHSEVACHGQAHVDLLVSAGGELIAIEVKRSHWSRVLKQAYLHRYCADRSYVAIPEMMLTEERLAEARHFDIGVLAVSESGVRIATEASRMKICRQHRMRLVKLLSSYSR